MTKEKDLSIHLVREDYYHNERPSENIEQKDGWVQPVCKKYVYPYHTFTKWTVVHKFLIAN